MTIGTSDKVTEQPPETANRAENEAENKCLACNHANTDNYHGTNGLQLQVGEHGQHTHK